MLHSLEINAFLKYKRYCPIISINSTVIHGISATLFFVGKLGFYPFPGNSKFEKENSLSANQNSLRVFDLAEREFSFSNLEFPGKG